MASIGSYRCSQMDPGRVHRGPLIRGGSNFGFGFAFIAKGSEKFGPLGWRAMVTGAKLPMATYSRIQT